MALVQLCSTFPGQVLKRLIKSFKSFKMFYFQLKAPHQTFCQLKSDKYMDGKNGRMLLLNNMCKGTVIS